MCGLRPTSSARCACRSRFGSSRSCQTRITWTAVMNRAMNVQPFAGQGNGSVATQNQPSWSSPSVSAQSDSSGMSWVLTPETLARALPVSEGGEQRAFRFRRDRLTGQRAGRRDRQPHLLDIRAATGAVRDVLVEARVQLLGQRALQVIRDKLDQLLAGELVVG